MNINDISDQFIRWLIYKGILRQEQYSKWDYWFRICLFNMGIIIPLIIVSIFLHTLLEVFVIGIVFNLLRVFIFNNGWHADTLEHCMCVTVIYMLVMGYLAQLCVFFIGVNIISTVLVSTIFGLISVLIMDSNWGKKFFSKICKYL